MPALRAERLASLPPTVSLVREPEQVGLCAYTGLKLIVGGITAGLFVPVFFASIGARIDPSTLLAEPVFLTAIVFAAFLGKLIGAGLPALAAGMGRREAAAIGIGMSARGAVELVVLSIAVEAGIIATGSEAASHRVYSVLVLMVLITTLTVPWLLPRVLKGPEETSQPTEK